VAELRGRVEAALQAALQARFEYHRFYYGTRRDLLAGMGGIDTETSDVAFLGWLFSLFQGLDEVRAGLRKLLLRIFHDNGQWRGSGLQGTVGEDTRQCGCYWLAPERALKVSTGRHAVAMAVVAAAVAVAVARSS